MEDHPQHPRPKQAHRVGAHAVETPPGAEALSLPTIAELIGHGQITVGVMEPIGWLAAAVDHQHNLATVRRLKGETMLELPARLDQAIDKAEALGIFTAEIN